jgi:hypothetical protein
MVDGGWAMEDVGAEVDEKVSKSFRAGSSDGRTPWIIEKKRVIYPTG